MVNQAVVKTPILIPSFSSKIGAFAREDLKEVLLWSKEFLTSATLLSAYDIFHNLHPSPSELGEITEILFVDSGGYETSIDNDISESYQTRAGTGAWDQEKLIKVYSEIPKEYNVVIVNFDESGVRQPIAQQAEHASRLFERFPHFNSNFLIKTESRDQKYVKLENVLESLGDLGRFRILGFTEKEIGNTALDRMRFIANVRMRLDSLGLDMPIHIFGSLDPVSTILYFIAGAEIFDGLTWLRYAYYQGMAVYSENFRFLERQPTEKNNASRKHILQNNIAELDRMRNEMILFAGSGKYSSFKYYAGQIERTVQHFDESIREGASHGR
jgi:hypothetical protein